MIGIFQVKQRKRVNGGFSLIELMVSLTLFSIVMTASVGTLLVLIDANAKSQALYTAMTNLSFALDSIGRNIRTGYEFNCDPSIKSTLPTSLIPTGVADCNNPPYATAIAFTKERNNDRVAYRFYTSQPGEGSIQEKIDPVTDPINGTRSPGKWVDLTSKDVVIEEFKIKTQDTAGFLDDGNDKQPVVRLIVKGYVKNGLDSNTKFELQTHITQRILNYYSD